MKTNNKKTPVRVIGLTGGIASGKTVATTALIKAGYTVIDADEVSRKMFACGTDGEKSIMLAFPQAAENGKLNRAALRKIIATDDETRQRLNALTHPAIIEHIKSTVATTSPPMMLSAPLLFESGLYSLCDVTICVYCPHTIRIKRLTARDGISTEDAERIIAAQMPDAERLAMSDYTISSDRDQAEFERAIVEVVERIIRNAECGMRN